MTNVFQNAKKLAVGLVLAGALSYSSDANAQNTSPQSANLSVSASIQASCTISTSPLNFGNTYDPVGIHNGTTGVDLQGTGTVTITCTEGAGVTVALDLGLNEGAGTQRMMINGASDTLNYDLYSDAGRTIPWNDTTGTVAETGTGAADVLTVYGSVPRGQTNAQAGSTYTDTVVASVAF